MSETSKMLITGGNIITMESDQPTVEALAIKDGMIIATGEKDECIQALGDEFKTFDLAGSTLLPGFIDTHTHPLVTIYYDMNADMRGVKSMSEMKSRLAALAEKSNENNWIVGLDFDEQSMKKAKLPDRHDLDDACPNHPAILVKHDGHMVIANTKAIELSKADEVAENPEGGVIDREESGFPTGVFRETAAAIPKSSIPFPEMDALIEGAKKTATKFLKKGITSVGGIFQTDDYGPMGDAGAFETMAMSALLDYFPINIYSLLFANNINQIEMVQQSPLNTQTPGGNKVGGMKLIADGSFGSFTSFMSEPFSDEPDKIGFLLFDEDEIYRRMLFIHQAGLQIAIHAIGDEAIRTCVKLYKKLLDESPREDHRHRIEHASLLDEKILNDIKDLGLVISTQPLFVHSEKHWLLKRLGEKRVKWVYPFKKIMDAKIPMAGASDSPVESIDVLHAIECLVTREGFEIQECLNVQQALEMYTKNAAYAQFEEEIKGSIKSGKRADFVVLEKSPFEVRADEISKIEIQKTMIDGKWIFEK